MSPSDSSRRATCTSAMYSKTARSSWLEAASRGRGSFGLEASTKVSASALSKTRPTERTEDERVVVCECLRVADARVLRAGVLVAEEHDVEARLAAMKRHRQRIEDEVGAHLARELPADDHPA